MSMRRATVTIPDGLERELQAWLDSQPAPPSLASVLQAALRMFLDEKRLEALEYQAPTGEFSFVVDGEGSGHSDVSIEHDAHFADSG